MPPHVKIKLLLKKLLPEQIFGIVLKLWRKTLAPFFAYNPDQKYYDLYVAEKGLVVSGGPFVGMKYIEESAGSVLFHKLVGYYESILHPTLEQIKNEKYDTIIDIGCAEGYYLVGLGRYLSDVHLIGYDIDERALTLVEKLASENNLKNKVTLDKKCTPEKLSAQITPNTLLICDAEGFEEKILNPEICPALLNVKKMIIETHDFAAPSVEKKLKDRFSKSHEISSVTYQMAETDKYPFLQQISNNRDLYYLLRERGEQEQVWLIMTKK
ncbi:MAG: methyltransferase domain-containing protein [Candidatus Nomurabacteria bacterium]|nr:methyltransferase domain-containing protein [Candidatus Nomurabacteria bacterium]USN88127.1 MAG: methyltransferase domain-containing protein [Candidatus Nomurabacteria bacterium]